MNSSHTCLAVDLGASSGRVISSEFDGIRISLTEQHRFVNEPITRNGTLYWNFDELVRQIKEGIGKSVLSGVSARSLAVDTWGVDFGLLDENGKLISPPVHYRDARTEGVMDDVWNSVVSKETIFAETGIQFLPFNTLYQLIALKRSEPAMLEHARRFLMMADLFHNQLCGSQTCEFTNATTTQLYNPTTKDWSWKLINEAGLPTSIFPEVLSPGTTLVHLKKAVREETGANDITLIASATHDTAAAVAAVPAEENGFAYLSCGTWSLLGIETKQPVINEKALALNFTNEGGVEGTIRLLKNIMGLWLLQECRRHWSEQGKDYSWEDLTAMTSQGKLHAAFIDPDDARFLPPGDMTQRVRNFCHDTNQSAPETDSDVVACITASLALKYCQVIEMLEELVEHRIPVLHMVGGGIRNELLCQWTANSIGRPVIAGPAEATAMGNAGMQLIAVGAIENLDQLRATVRRSIEMKRYEPQDVESWESAYEKAQRVMR